VTAPARRTTVGVNLLWLVPGVVGGSEDYIARLLHALARRAPDDLELVLFALRPFPAAHPELAEHFRTVVAPLDGSNKALRVAAESTWLAPQVRRAKVDVVHHAGGRVPSVSPAPSLVTIHDLQPLELPANFSTVKRRFLHRALPRSAARAAMVATPSEFVRRRVVELLRVAPERTTVVAAPVRDRSSVTLTRDTPAVAAVLDGDEPFFVYPAITYPHKNHATLLRAFARLRDERPDVRLVLTGGEGSEEPAVGALVSALGIGHSVVRTGRVPRGDLDSLLAGAAALVFPSRYEGFGLPVLEAMAAGCPVIAADATALPEVVDGVGALVDPDDVDGWTRAMATALCAPRGANAAAEQVRAERFTPERSVDALVSAYRRARG
jgi:glycosyltransferase involved in cell wall biosynthesis